MISDVDIRDWEKVDCAKAREYVDSLDDYCRMGVSINPYGNVSALLHFIDQVEAIMKKQVAQKAALFQPAKAGRADIKGLIPQDDGCGWG